MEKTIYVVRVRDTYCGMRGEYVEECITTVAQEAADWFKQWRGEYDPECGYKVTRKAQPWSQEAWDKLTQADLLNSWRGV